PWDPPAKWAGQYDWRNVDAPSPPLPADSWLPPEAAAHHRRLQSELGIPREVQLKIRALYYAKISHIDDWIGRILSVIRKRGWADHTAVIFWSDHGEMLGDKGRYYKGVFYEESVRVPFLLRLADGSCGGQVQSQPVSLVDAFPTILELAGAKQRPREFGRSLVRFAVDPTTQHHDAVFSEIDGRIMVYDGQYKMVVTSHRTVLKLYDIERDPRETRNLLGLPETEPVVRRLLDRLAHWHLETTTDWRHFMKKGAPDD
ncbi:MAG: sulfatase family protein, partial [Kiritimatiellia bacterium]